VEMNLAHEGGSCQQTSGLEHALDADLPAEVLVAPIVAAIPENTFADPATAVATVSQARFTSPPAARTRRRFKPFEDQNLALQASQKSSPSKNVRSPTQRRKRGSTGRKARSGASQKSSEQSGFEMIFCDSCSYWYHLDCAGVVRDDDTRLTNGDVPFICEECVKRPGQRDPNSVDQTACGKAGCTRPIIQEGEYVIESIIGRRSAASIDMLVKWEGYPVQEATWEPEAELEKSGSSTVINVLYEKFKAKATSEGLDIPPAWPKGTCLLLGEAVVAGWS